jgi:hypothetical protein
MVRRKDCDNIVRNWWIAPPAELLTESCAAPGPSAPLLCVVVSLEVEEPVRAVEERFIDCVVDPTGVHRRQEVLLPPRVGPGTAHTHPSHANLSRKYFGYETSSNSENSFPGCAVRGRRKPKINSARSCGFSVAFSSGRTDSNVFSFAA